MIRLSHDKAYDREAWDRDLLLLAHGALPLVPRLRVELHLRRCAECGARLARLTQTSARLALEIRGPDLPAWSRTAAVSRARSPAGKWVVLSAVTALIATVCVLVYMSSSTVRPAPHFTLGVCRPDLPNSRCR